VSSCMKWEDSESFASSLAGVRGGLSSLSPASPSGPAGLAAGMTSAFGRLGAGLELP
jgi:hypothetical protein